MTKTDAINHFGSQAALADALGISRPAVSQWSETIPEVRQWQIRAITEGRLEVDLKHLHELGADPSQVVPPDAPEAPAPLSDAFVASLEAV